MPRSISINVYNSPLDGAKGFMIQLIATTFSHKNTEHTHWLLSLTNILSFSFTNELNQMSCEEKTELKKTNRESFTFYCSIYISSVDPFRILQSFTSDESSWKPKEIITKMFFNTRFSLWCSNRMYILWIKLLNIMKANVQVFLKWRSPVELKYTNNWRLIVFVYHIKSNLMTSITSLES